MHPLFAHHRRALRNLGRDGIPLDVVKEFDDHVNVSMGKWESGPVEALDSMTLSGEHVDD